MNKVTMQVITDSLTERLERLSQKLETYERNQLQAIANQEKYGQDLSKSILGREKRMAEITLQINQTVDAIEEVREYVLGN